MSRLGDETPRSFRATVLWTQWVILPLINYIFWYQYGQRQRTNCSALLVSPGSTTTKTTTAAAEAAVLCPPSTSSRRRLEASQESTIQCPRAAAWQVELELLSSEAMTAYKYEQLARMRYPQYTTLLNHHPSVLCTSYVNPHASQKHISNKQGSCLAVIASEGVSSTYNLLRFDQGPRWSMMNYTYPLEIEMEMEMKMKIKGKVEKGIQTRTHTRWMPTGFFTKAGSERGRERLREKMGPFLRLLPSIRAKVVSVLAANGFTPGITTTTTTTSSTGQDITVMVVNEGELDLLLNFVCSCRQNNISMNNVLVFAGSPGVVRVIESLGVGAMSVYHESFGAVNKDASSEYLDRTFVDMMWYKAFSVWLLLSLKYNVLFQDVDLVWFREPFSYFREYIKLSKANHFGIYPDAFFSDDGQRGLRYSPFYANSGFYYLVHSKRTEFFAYTIMNAFDLLHVTGSHQNVFTTKLIENMDLARISPKLLSLDLFSTGVKYHHDKPFMRGIKEGYEHPYNFHMCWTLNKANKIDYFRRAQMWYLRGGVGGGVGGGGGGEGGCATGADIALKRASAGGFRGLWFAGGSGAGGDGGNSLTQCCQPAW